MMLDLLENTDERVESGAGDSLVHFYCVLCRTALGDELSLCGKDLTGRGDVPDGVDEDRDCVVCLDLYRGKKCRREHYLI